MPRFDTDDGERRFHHHGGIDLADSHDVPAEVMSLLRDLAHIHLPVGLRVMSIEVRNETGRPVYRGMMTVVGSESSKPRAPERV